MSVIAAIPTESPEVALSTVRTFSPGKIVSTFPTRSRLLYGDPLRMLACIAVVGVHVTMQISENTTHVGSAAWWYCALWDGAVRWAVPAFVMLSGALLLEPCPGETMGQFYWKRLRRLGPVLLFWPAFYMLWRSYYSGEHLTVTDWVRALLGGAPFHHLHFLFALPGLYLFTPMLRVYLTHASKAEFRLLTVAVLVITILSGAIQEYRGVEFAKGFNSLTRFLPFLGFYLSGNALRDLVLSRFGMVLAAAGLLESAFLYAAWTTWLVHRFPGNSFQFYFSSQYSLTRFLGGACAFLLLSNLLRQGTHWRTLDRVVSWLAPTALGIYLIHPVFIDLWGRVGVSVYRPNVWLGVVVTWTCTWTASLAATVLLRRIPFLRRIVG